VKLVEHGRVVYRESFRDQAARAEQTWERFAKWEPSPLVADYLRRFEAMRAFEIAEARQRLEMKNTGSG
jgi:nicotinate phosphoribosyltransferase